MIELLTLGKRHGWELNRKGSIHDCNQGIHFPPLAMRMRTMELGFGIEYVRGWRTKPWSIGSKQAEVLTERLLYRT
jgi:hypothetical protein